MKILVCISHVPDTTSKINFSDDLTKFDTNGVQFVINPLDEFALTRAMWFKEKQGASVTVISIGLANTEPTLRKALAIGADEAIRVNVEPTDGYQVATQLAEVAKKEGFDLVLAGKESLDYNGGMVPGMMAEILGYNFVNACISIDVEGNSCTVSREIDGGIEVLSCDLPLIIGGQKGMVEEKDLRIPNMRGIMMARKKPLKVVEPVSFDLTTSTLKYEKPKAKGECKLIDLGNLDELIQLLHNEAKVI